MSQWVQLVVAVTKEKEDEKKEKLFIETYGSNFHFKIWVLGQLDWIGLAMLIEITICG